MRNEGHPNEEMLHMYLDGELDPAERGRVEAHLADCAECQAEVAALRRLFAALDELAPEPVPDLVPGVLMRIRPRQPRALGRRAGPLLGRRWVLPALQAAFALLLIAGAVYGTIAFGVLPVEVLQDTWTVLSGWVTARWDSLSAWTADQWAGISSWPGAIWAGIESSMAQVSAWGDLGLSSLDVVILGSMLAILWVVGNVVLLRRIRLNGRPIKRRY